MALLGLGHAGVDRRQLGAGFDLSQGAVERGAVDFRLQVCLVAIAICLLHGLCPFPLQPASGTRGANRLRRRSVRSSSRCARNQILIPRNGLNDEREDQRGHPRCHRPAAANPSGGARPRSAQAGSARGTRRSGNGTRNGRVVSGWVKRKRSNAALTEANVTSASNDAMLPTSSTPPRGRQRSAPTATRRMAAAGVLRRGQRPCQERRRITTTCHGKEEAARGHHGDQCRIRRGKQRDARQCAGEERCPRLHRIRQRRRARRELGWC